MIFSVKPFKYTRHARNRMRLHGITEKEVESAIEKPEHLECSVEGRLNAWTKIAERFLRVTYKKERPDDFLVISAVKKRKGWR